MEVIFFSCSTKRSRKLQLLIRTRLLKNKDFFPAYKLGYSVLIMLINVNMPTIVGILLRNEFDFWNVHGIMNTSGHLQSFTLTLHETLCK